MQVTDKKSAQPSVATSLDLAARDWIRVLAAYRNPAHGRSFFELAVTFGPFLAIWALAWWALSISYALALVLAVGNGFFLVRLFAIQHDCGHGAFFKQKQLNDWVGRVIGVFTVTPYDVWRRSHSIHHSASGNLDKRGMGDILTLTVDEYNARTRWGKLMYRAYRHPLTLFAIGPIYVFLFEQRLPLGFMKDGWRYWVSSMGTNVGIALIVTGLIYFGGLMPFLLVYLPTVVAAATIGVWLFYVQHQFEETHWDDAEQWDMHEAALYGSSHYDLPVVLRWLTANIGVHHVHHLYSRIPFYRLMDVLRDHPSLADVKRLTLWESFACVKLQLWDANSRKLVSYAEARLLPVPVKA